MARRTQVSDDTIRIAERRRQALELKRAGATYEVIAQQLGYNDRGHAYRDIHVALANVTKQPAEELVAEEIDRCDAMILGLWPKARKGDAHAVDRVLRCMDLKARYRGLYAPTRQIVQVITEDLLDAEIRRLQDELAARGEPVD